MSWLKQNHTNSWIINNSYCPQSQHSIVIQVAMYNKLSQDMIIAVTAVLRYALPIQNPQPLTKLSPIQSRTSIQSGCQVFEAAMSKIQPFYLRNVGRDVIPQIHNKNTWNSMNNYFICIHTKILFSYTLYYWEYNMIFIPNIYTYKYLPHDLASVLVKFRNHKVKCIVRHSLWQSNFVWLIQIFKCHCQIPSLYWHEEQQGDTINDT